MSSAPPPSVSSDNQAVPIEILPETDYQHANARRSRPRMTRFERCRVIAMRSEQIANGTVRNLFIFVFV